jgi:hypothetical protein
MSNYMCDKFHLFEHNFYVRLTIQIWFILKIAFWKKGNRHCSHFVNLKICVLLWSNFHPFNYCYLFGSFDLSTWQISLIQQPLFLPSHCHAFSIGFFSLSCLTYLLFFLPCLKPLLSFLIPKVTIGNPFLWLFFLIFV